MQKFIQQIRQYALSNSVMQKDTCDIYVHMIVCIKVLICQHSKSTLINSYIVTRYVIIWRF